MFNYFKSKRLVSAVTVATVVACASVVSLNVNADSSNGGKSVIDLTKSTSTVTTQKGHIDLQILATSDSHGRFLPYDYAINSPNTLGSLAQISSAVNQFRSQNPKNTILVDAGDIIQDNSASLFLNDKVNPMMLAMNQIGYDTLTFGNHEFNYGVPTLMKVIKQFKGKALCGNVYDSKGQRIAAPYTIVERSGIKVGIIGMVTPNITRWDAANLKNYKVTNPVAETNAAIAELKKQNVNVIVAVEHMGETEEYNAQGSAAMDVLDKCPGIDAFVAAHFHVKIPGDYFYNHKAYTLNTTTNAVTATAMDGTQTAATLADYNNAKAHGVVIVEPYKWGQSLSQINIDLAKNSAGKYLRDGISSNLYDMATKKEVTFQPDKKLSNILQSYSQKAIDDANTPIGSLKGGDLAPKNEINGVDQSLLQPSPMIDLINKVQMYYGAKIAKHPIDVSSAALFKNGQNITQGEIKKCGTANIYQFDNTLYVLKITGKELKKYMEWSVGYYHF